MQLTIELPDTLGDKLKTMPNFNDFIVKILDKSLQNSEILETDDSWDNLNIEEIAIETGIEDLAENHDHYLYGTPKRS
ncbi:MAG: hypothetical protein GQ569_09590 [Methylococcaceae bacterium]|nr:hypothetical protein [Methylococcaceae bacterium]